MSNPELSHAVLTLVRDPFVANLPVQGLLILHLFGRFDVEARFEWFVDGERGICVSCSDPLH